METETAPDTGPGGHPDEVPDHPGRSDNPDHPDYAAERAALVTLCLYALDRARSPGVTERLEEGLAEIGVLADRPDGQRFDPSAHEAGGVVPTGDAGLDGLVAETEVAGFTDRGQVLRVPVVTVYQHS